MKKLCVLWLALVCVFPTYAATRTVVSGHVTAAHAGAAPAAQIRFTLTRCDGTPKVAGAGTLIFERPDKSFLVVPGADGTFTVSLWGNDLIACGAKLGRSKWLMTVYVNSALSAEAVYSISGATFDLDAATPE